MHRSGSSALSRVVNLLGATAPATLLPPGTDNPRGFWESARLVSMHDELLQSAGSYWHDWRPLDPAWFRTPIAAEFKNRLKQGIESEFGDATLLVIKDPRICRMVPFWTELLTELEIEPVALTPLRNPLEVAKSLQTRNGFRLEKSLLLWLRHVLEAERDSRSLRRSFVSYESLLTDWRACLGRAASQTGLEWSGLSSETEQHVDQFLTRDLHREMALEADLLTNPIAAGWVSSTYRLLASLIDDPNDSSALNALDHICHEFEAAGHVIGGLLRIEEEIAGRLRSELTMQGLYLTELQKEIGVLRQKIDELDSQLVQSRTETLSERSRNANAERQLGQLRQLLSQGHYTKIADQEFTLGYFVNGVPATSREFAKYLRASRAFKLLVRSIRFSIRRRFRI